MPIEKLNDDVLAEVFKAAVDLANIPDGASRLGVSRTLSHVCSRWRRVALSTPSLWSASHVFWPLTTADCDRIELLLVRSGVLLLDIELTICLDDVLTHDARRNACMSLLLSRCNVLGMRPNPRLSGLLIDLGETLRTLDFPSTYLLSELHVTSACVERGDVPALLSALQSCQVKHLWMDCVMFSWELDEPLSILFEFPSLLTFHAADALGEDDLIRGGLEVFESVADDYRITLPSLQTLDISTPFLQRPLNVSNFQSIRRLILSVFSPSRKYVAETICGLPRLEDLVLDVTVGRGIMHLGHGDHPNEDIPPEWSPPSLVSIDFDSSSKFDDIARFLVKGTTTDVLGAGSLKFVDISHCELAADLRAWIIQRVPTVKAAMDQSSVRSTGQKANMWSSDAGRAHA